MNTSDTLPELHDVAGYLADRLPGFQGPLTITKFPTGQSNPTFRLDTPSRSYVLRSKPTGTLLKSAHAVDREHRVMTALRKTDVPVPRTYLYCEDKAVIGAEFFVMEYVDGRTIADPRAPELGSDVAARAELYDQMNRVLAAIHSLDVEKIGLSDYGKPSEYFSRQIRRWTTQYHASKVRENADMDRLGRWLEEHLPPDDGRACLVHGDFRIDNLLFSRMGSEVVAVLDWELSTLGHPFADLAYQCMQWRVAVDAPLQGLGGVDRQSLGIPYEAQYVSTYCQRMGISGIPNWEFYIAFSFFRLAAILEGVLKRAVDGNASNPRQARRLGEMVPQLAMQGMKAIS